MSEARIDIHPILGEKETEGTVEFNFNGEPMKAMPGEMISTALFANGVRVFGHHHRDGAAQGMFCANGQCSQCLVLADGVPVKSCIVPVKPGMDVRSMEGLPKLKADDSLSGYPERPEVVDTQVLIIGGGPAGLMAAVELAEAGVDCLICDDKQVLGGKLSLQTHNFFGSVKECFAGSRGMDIGINLEKQVYEMVKVTVWTDAPVVGVFDDGLAGVVKEGTYTLVKPERILVTAGAREKTLAFPGADIPGVYGAGAFQTLVNRDLVRPSEKLFIIGGGNVGLIAAYHALQAGIDVVGLVEALPQCGGYKVHEDKIRRLGVPVWTSHTVLRIEGEEKIERIIICEIDNKFQPVPGTEAEFFADTVLVAVGLSPVDELFHEAKKANIPVYSAGDAQEIAEASAAMFSGRITGRKILAEMGMESEIPEKWYEMIDMLRARPGPNAGFYPPPEGEQVYPVIRCEQEIPCNPCIDSCSKGAVTIPEGNILGRPKLDGECIGCMKCVAICPGLAISLVDKRYDKDGINAKVTVPWELPEGTVEVGQEVTTTGFEGEVIGRGKILRFVSGEWLNMRMLMQLEVPMEDCDKVAGIRIREPLGKEAATSVRACDDGEVVVCRCERVTKADIVKYIQDSDCRDFNTLKAALRTGMGPCGGKTCTNLIWGIFRQLGVDFGDIEPHLERPFTQEVPLKSFLGGDDE